MSRSNPDELDYRAKYEEMRAKLQETKKQMEVAEQTLRKEQVKNKYLERKEGGAAISKAVEAQELIKTLQHENEQLKKEQWKTKQAERLRNAGVTRPAGQAAGLGRRSPTASVNTGMKRPASAVTRSHHRLNQPTHSNGVTSADSSAHSTPVLGSRPNENDAGLSRGVKRLELPPSMNHPDSFINADGSQLPSDTRRIFPYGSSSSSSNSTSHPPPPLSQHTHQHHNIPPAQIQRKGIDPEHIRTIGDIVATIESRLPHSSSSSSASSSEDAASGNTPETFANHRGVSLDYASNNNNNNYNNNQGTLGSTLGNTFDSELHALKRELSQKSAAIALLQSHFDHLQMSFRGEKEIQAQALKQCEDFKVMLQESRSTIADLRRDLRTRELEAEQLPTLKKLLREAEAERDRVSQQLREITSENVTSGLAEHGEVKKAISAALERETKARAELSVAKAEMDSLKQQLEEVSKLLASQRKETQVVRDKATRLERDLEATASTLKDAQHKLACVNADTGVDFDELREALDIIRRRSKNTGSGGSGGSKTRGVALTGVDKGSIDDEDPGFLRTKIRDLEAKALDLAQELQRERKLRMLKAAVSAQPSSSLSSQPTIPKQPTTSTHRGVAILPPTTSANKTLQQGGVSSDTTSGSGSTSDSALGGLVDTSDVDSLFQFDEDDSVLHPDINNNNEQPSLNEIALRIKNASLIASTPSLQGASLPVTTAVVRFLDFDPVVSHKKGGYQPEYDHVVQATVAYDSKLASRLQTTDATVTIHRVLGGSHTTSIGIARIPLSHLLKTSREKSHPSPYSTSLTKRVTAQVPILSPSDVAIGTLTFDLRSLYPIYSPSATTNPNSHNPNESTNLWRDTLPSNNVTSTTSNPSTSSTSSSTSSHRGVDLSNLHPNKSGTSTSATSTTTTPTSTETNTIENGKTTKPTEQDHKTKDDNGQLEESDEVDMSTPTETLKAMVLYTQPRQDAKIRISLDICVRACELISGSIKGSGTAVCEKLQLIAKSARHTQGRSIAFVRAKTLAATFTKQGLMVTGDDGRDFWRRYLVTIDSTSDSILPRDDGLLISLSLPDMSSPLAGTPEGDAIRVHVGDFTLPLSQLSSKQEATLTLDTKIIALGDDQIGTISYSGAMRLDYVPAT